MRIKSRRAFSLLEIILVIAILVLFLLVLIPAFHKPKPLQLAPEAKPTPAKVETAPPVPAAPAPEKSEPDAPAVTAPAPPPLAPIKSIDSSAAPAAEPKP